MLTIPSSSAASHPLTPQRTPGARADGTAPTRAAAEIDVARAEAQAAAAAEAAREKAEYKPPESALRDLKLPFSVGFGAGLSAETAAEAAAKAAAAAQARDAALRSGYALTPVKAGSKLDTSV